MLRMAVASLVRNRLRTSLTILGLGIGIAAVICTAALGAAGTQRIQQQINALGEDFLWVRAGSRNVGGIRTGFGGVTTLKPDDATAIVNEVPGITACSPEVQGREQVISGNQNWNTRYQAVWPTFFEIRHRLAAHGVVFSEVDQARAERVIVLGQGVADRLFPDENPLDRAVRMNGFPFRVIAVLEPKGATRGGIDRDDAVIVPLATATRYLQRREWVTDIMCDVASPAQMGYAEFQVTSLLRLRHRLTPGSADDFQIQQPIEILQMRAQSASTMAWMLTAIGGVSLIVGGVGIMNIMLVSVTERRREIGVRMAIGARMRDIRRQFLLEAAALGLVGGVVGIGLGWLGSWALSAAFHWPTLISPVVVASSTAAALTAGLAFGYFPAHHASRLDPLEAIRTED